MLASWLLLTRKLFFFFFAFKVLQANGLSTLQLLLLSLTKQLIPWAMLKSLQAFNQRQLVVTFQVNSQFFFSFLFSYFLLLLLYFKLPLFGVAVAKIFYVIFVMMTNYGGANENVVFDVVVVIVGLKKKKKKCWLKIRFEDHVAVSGNIYYYQLQLRDYC